MATNGLDDLVNQFEGVPKLRPLYRSEDLKTADPAATVFVLDNEEDVDKLIVREQAATTNCVGNPEFTETLRDRKVAIFFKGDDDSCRNAWLAANELLPVAANVCVVALATPLSDFFEKNGGTREQLLDDVEKAGPVSELKIEFELARLRGDQAQQQRGQFQRGGTAHGGGNKANQADAMVALALAGSEFFHDDDVPYATIDLDDHRETWPLQSKRYRLHIIRLFNEATNKVPDEKAVRGAINTLSGRALFKGPQAKVHVRIAATADAMYLDLADDHWRAVEVRATGWSIIQDPPVKFRRPRGMMPLPDPVKGGSIDELRPFLSTDDDDFVLTVAWLVSALRGRGPYLVLVLHGDQGCGKSTRARIVRGLVDPNISPLRRRPRNEEDLMIAASHGHVVAFDNLSYLAVWLSDSFCILATGGGLSKRELYTDSEEVILDAQRPVIINGIEELATRGDLLDRPLIFYLPEITEAHRQEESKLNARFESARPRILGALLDAVVVALQRENDVRLDRLPRMADVAVWVTAAAPALGWEEDRFLAAYDRNRADAAALAIESSIVASEIRKLTLPWTGTAEQLLDKLNGETPWETVRSRAWPKHATKLSGALRRIRSNLRESDGIEIEFLPRERARRPIKITKVSSAACDAGDAGDPEKQTMGKRVLDARGRRMIPARHQPRPEKPANAAAKRVRRPRKARKGRKR
jgi:hypothetical protein